MGLFSSRTNNFRLIISIFLLLWIGNSEAVGQFYNGHRMTFGKNRVQYNNFYWQYYRFERFDVYFSQEGGDLALYAETVIAPELDRIESQFDYVIEKRIIFLVYNKLTDFRQSNIGLITGIDEYNTGGVTRIVDNKVFLYFDGDRDAFDRQIRASIAEVLVNEMIYGSALTANMATSATINTPEWFHRGLVAYMGEPWSVEMDDRLKDGIRSGRYKNFTRLTGEDAEWAGHSFWRFIENEYGHAVIPNIVYITRINRNIRNGFLFVLGSDMKSLSREWLNYYTEIYANEDGNPFPDVAPEIRRPRRNRVYQNLNISPNGRNMAYVTNDMGQFRVWVRNLETGRQRSILRRGQRLEQIQDYTYPVLAWHPSGDILLIIYQEKGGIRMTFYDASERKIINTRNLLYFEKILDADFSPDGSRIVFSAMRFGRSDIYVHTFASATNEQLTDDIADDFNPRFIDNGRRIIFSSNRMDDSIRFEGATLRELSPYRSLFIYDYANRSRTLMSLADEPYVNQADPIELSRNRYAFLSDQSGVINRYVVSLDSVVAFIDTTTHYRYIVESQPLTNFSRNIMYQDVEPRNRVAFNLFRNNGRFNYFRTPLEDNVVEPLPPTSFRTETVRRNRIADSIAFEARNAIPPILLDNGNILTSEGDTVVFDMERVNIYRYVFEVEKLNFFQNEFEFTDFILENDSIRNQRNQIRIYQTAFYPNYLVSQVDFSFLEATYQAYTGGAVYYNPGFNVLFKLGANDLFEDYKVIGGIRLSGDFQSNEYLLSFENLKHRLDRQIVYHRQAFENVARDDYFNEYYLKTVTQNLYYSLRWPFSQTLAVKGTISIRDDYTSFLTDNMNTITRIIPGYRRNWAGLKGELIFDNTRKIGVNILDGLRYKVFAETYWQLNEASDLFVIGADFRYYRPIHRNLIWASRFATSTSFGRSRLLYYLGSLDNWITFFIPQERVFDQTVRVDNQENYAYQALATNMRGFSQNIRNGNNFALINNEIRWPFIQYFARYPLSNFWSSLQLVGFFDAGSAWSGVSPWGRTSAYDFEEIHGGFENEPGGQGSVVLTLETGRDPFVYGYGFGLRAQMLGYFMRFDWAWGVENKEILPRIFYFSMSLDF